MHREQIQADSTSTGRQAGSPQGGEVAIPEEPRSWLSRTADEVAAWLGDVDAAGRRQRDKAVGDHTGQAPLSTAATDAWIENELNQRLTYDARLDASRISAQAMAGAVTLVGAVNTNAERNRAEDIATATPGVNQVHNRLMVA